MDWTRGKVCQTSSLTENFVVCDTNQTSRKGGVANTHKDVCPLWWCREEAQRPWRQGEVLEESENVVP